jgi:enoyl-CoA hydratase/carnithine racemase
METNKPLLVERQGAVCTLVINNPDKHNVVTPDCLFEMADTFDNLSRDDEIRAVVIRGAGDRAFSAGYDISILPSKSHSENRAADDDKSPFEKAMEAIGRYPYPVIAMLNGFAFGGGCELALTCDIRIASEHIRMGMPPAKIGLVYRYSGLRRFLAILGYNRTLELFLTARFYDSQKCLEMGLVNHLVEKDELENFTYNLAREITANAPLSLKSTKFILNRIVEYPEVPPEDVELFRSLSLQAFQSEDLEEGKKAFKEKRKPVFKGR